MRILITGVGGNVGQYLAEKYSRDGIDVIGVYRHNAPKNNQYIIHKADLYTDDLDEVIKEDVDVVIHAAACLSGTTEQLVNDNIIATKRLIEYSLRSKVKTFIYLSSVSVYGDVHEELNLSSPVCNPTTYGITKLLSEKIVTESLIPQKIIIQLPRMLGPYVDLKKSAGSGFLIMTQKLLKNEDIKCNIFDSSYNNYLHVHDLACFIEHILESRMETGKFILGARDNYTMGQILTIMKEAIGSKSDIIATECSKNPACSVIDISEACLEGFNPQSSDAILSRFIKEMNEAFGDEQLLEM